MDWSRTEPSNINIVFSRNAINVEHNREIILLAGFHLDLILGIDIIQDCYLVKSIKISFPV